MKLIDEWKIVLRKAWSTRLAALSSVLAVLQAVVPSLDGLIPPSTFALLSALTAILAIVARVIDQPSMSAPTDPEAAEVQP